MSTFGILLESQKPFGFIQFELALNNIFYFFSPHFLFIYYKKTDFLFFFFTS